MGKTDWKAEAKALKKKVRKLKDQLSIPAVGHYIRNQPSPLLVWTRDEGRIV